MVVSDPYPPGIFLAGSFHECAFALDIEISPDSGVNPGTTIVAL